MKIKKFENIFVILIIFLFSFTIFSSVTLAHDPQAIELDYDYINEILTVTITHEVSDPNEHYIEKVSIEIMGEIIREEIYTSQPAGPTFTYSYEIPANIGEQINVTAYCSEGGSISGTITVKTDPPDKPRITGPSKGTVGVRYEWTFVSTDPEGEDIEYYIDWGECCGGYERHGPLPSGQELVVGHTYNSIDTFSITAKAIDECGSESDWAIHDVTIPRERAIYRPILRFLQNHPHIFPIIRYLLGI